MSEKNGNVKTPTRFEMLDAVWGDTGDLVEVSREVNDDWRHGCSIVSVLHRKSDNTHWMVCYRVSTDGEFNALRDDDGWDVEQCKPVRYTAVKFVPIKDNG